MKMESLDVVLSYSNSTTSPKLAVPSSIMGLPTSSPFVVASGELVVYIALCASVIIRYRHHVLHYIYRDSPRLSSPRFPFEAFTLMFFSTGLLSAGAWSIFSSYGRQTHARTTFDDVPSALLFFLIAVLDWREEVHFQAYLAQYREQQATTIEQQTPYTDTEKAESTLSTPSSPTTPSVIEGKPSPTATNIHVQYQLRTSIKALLAYAALVITQLDLARAEGGLVLASTIYGIPASMAIGTIYLVRGIVLAFQGERFRRGNGGVRL